MQEAGGKGDLVEVDAIARPGIVNIPAITITTCSVEYGGSRPQSSYRDWRVEVTVDRLAKKRCKKFERFVSNTALARVILVDPTQICLLSTNH